MAEVNQVLVPPPSLIPGRFGLETGSAKGGLESLDLLLQCDTIRRQLAAFHRRGQLTPFGQLQRVAKVNQVLVPPPSLIPGCFDLETGGVQGGFESMDLLPEPAPVAVR